MSDKKLALMLLVGAALIFGIVGYVAQDAMLGMSVYAYTGIRFLIGSPLLLLLALHGRKRPNGGVIGSGVLVGLAMTTAMLTQNLALQVDAVGRVSFFGMSRLVMVAVLPWLVKRQSPARKTVLGIAIAMLGTFFLFHAPDGRPTGDLLSIASAITFAVAALMLSRACRLHDWRWIAFFQVLTVGSLSIMPGLPELALRGITPDGWRDLLFAGLLATSLGFAIEAWAIRHLRATITTTILSMEAPFAILLAVPLGMTMPTLQSLAASAVIFIGAYLVVNAPSPKNEVQSFLEARPKASPDSM